jgi:Uma2 family endonuclease
MAVATNLFPVHRLSNEEESRVLLHDVPWSVYVVLRDAITSRRVRMTFLEGALEIMTVSRLHELIKKQMARLLELFCLERDIPLYAYGGLTLRKEEKERGLEPDECYCRGADHEVPHIAIEVVISSPLLDKLEVYRGLGVREVWVYQDGGIRVFELREDQYQAIEGSQVIPEVDLAEIVKYALEKDQHEALKAYRAALRG